MYVGSDFLVNRKVVVIGASGHGKVIADIILKSHDILVGFIDDGVAKDTIIFDNYKVLGDTTMVNEYKDCLFIIGVGTNEIRKKIADKLDVNYYIAIHPNAIIASQVHIEEGTCVMAKTVINMDAHIGKHCIINTGSIVEHDCVLHDYVHVSPNATVCGGVEVGELTQIGASATIRNYKNITANTTIGMGAVVCDDINEEGVYVGIPAKKMK